VMVFNLFAGGYLKKELVSETRLVVLERA
jgi:hypothetical protein